MTVENLYSYTEVDPNSRIGVTANRATFTALTRNETAYLYKDFGAAYFSGDFYFSFSFNASAFTSDADPIYPIVLTNTLGDWKSIDDAAASAIGIRFDGNSGGIRIRCTELDSGTEWSGSPETIVGGIGATEYYGVFRRDEAVGAQGTIYIALYSDDGFTTNFGTVSLALHTSKKDFRYLQFVTTDNETDADSATGYIEDITISAGTLIPSVTQQEPTNIASTSITINGTIDSIGGSAVTQHGACWVDDATYAAGAHPPTTADTKTTEGSAGVGAFSTNATSLTPGTKYWVKTYATNTAGTAYSGIVSFTAGGTSTDILIAGAMKVVQTRLHYVDKNGDERYVEGTLA